MLISKTAPRKTLFWKIARHLAAIVAIVLLGGLLSATLVRLAPGFDSDERELDPGLSAESVRALRQSRAGEHNILRYYSGYLRAAWHGDLGTSHASANPCKAFCASAGGHFARGRRWPVAGVAAGIAAGLHRLPVACSGIRDDGDHLSGAFLCIPAAVLALLSVILNAPGYLAIALIVFPRSTAIRGACWPKPTNCRTSPPPAPADWAKCASWPGTCCPSPDRR